MSANRSEKLAYTVEEAAELLSVSRAHLYRLIDSGELGSISIGRCRRITLGQLTDFIARTEAQSGQPRTHFGLRNSTQPGDLRASSHGQKSR